MFYYRKFALYTLGCKLNYSEGSSISRNLTAAGYQQVDFSEVADFYIINTCSVTDNADKKCRSLVRQILRKAANAKVIIVGCYAQLKPDEIASIPGVAMVLGAAEKFEIAKHLEQIQDNETKVIAGAIRDVSFYTPSFSFGERTRSFLKVQDGCDYFCTFCTIPLARGRSRSASIEKTVAVAKEIALSGVKEVVLTGVNIGDYGKTEDGKRRTNENLLQLIQELDNIQGIDRWRISSIEPNLLNNEIIQFVAASKHFMPHFHIPLQSGSDKILKHMHRKYDTALYQQRVAYIKQNMPHACIGVDVIVGYPEESEQDFIDTCNFIDSIDVSYLHVFTYSERDNTVAIRSTNSVPIEERRRRNEVLRLLSDKKRRAFYEQHLQTERPVLFEMENDEGYMYGFTDNYIKVKTRYNETLCNSIQTVSINKLLAAGFAGITFENEEIKA